MTKKGKIQSTILYLLMFTIIAGIIFFSYRLQGLSFVNRVGDGFRQHYKALLYYSNYLRDIFNHLLHEGKLIIPQWDFSIGEGSDVIQTLHYYCVGDPIAFLCVFFNSNNMYIFYDLSILLRILLSGLTFIYLCFETGIKSKEGIATGAIVYSFCVYVVIVLANHPFFLNPTIYLPLIICGIAKLINKNNPYLLIISVFFASISNIYFFYIIVILVISYSFVRVLLINKEIKEKVKTLLLIGLYSSVGVLMSAIVFLPSFYVLINNERLFMNNDIGLFYGLDYYLNLIPSIFMAKNGYFGGFTIVGLFAICLMFIKHNNKTLIALFLLGMVYECLPIFGSILNGMSYVTDRWLFGFSLLIAYIISYYFDDIVEYKNKILFVVASSILVALSILINNVEFRVYLFFLFVTICFVVFTMLSKTSKYHKYAYLLLAFFYVGFYVSYYYTPLYWNRAKAGSNINELINVANDETTVINDIKDDSFWRYSGNSLDVNSSVLNGHSTTNFYWSIDNGGIANYRKELGLLDHSTHHYDDNNYRFSILSLNSVKYYVLEKGVEQVPYGFEFIKDYGEYSLYENSNFIPLISSYDTYITFDNFDKLNPINKQVTMLDSVVLESKQEEFKENVVSNKNHSFEYSITNEEDVLIKNNTITVNKENAKAFINSKYDEAGEYYLVFEGLDSNTSSKWEVKTRNVFEVVNFKSKSNPTYSERHDFVVNLGYRDSFDDEIVINFPDKGIFTYDSIKMYCLPVEEQVLYLNNLKDIGINNIDIQNNNIYSDINIDEDKILYFSIPYNDGWRAYLDGDEVNILKANLGYMAITASSGNHNIHLEYNTPLLKEGVITSIFGVLTLIGIMVYRKKLNKVS